MTKRTNMPPPVTPAEARKMLLEHLPPHVMALLADVFPAQAAAVMNRLACTARDSRDLLNAVKKNRSADTLRGALRIAADIAAQRRGTPAGEAATRAVADLALIIDDQARPRAFIRKARTGAASPDVELRRGLALLVLGLPDVSQRQAAAFAAAVAPLLGAKHVEVRVVENELIGIRIGPAHENEPGSVLMTDASAARD